MKKCESRTKAHRENAAAEADAVRQKIVAEAAAVAEQETTAALLSKHPELLKLRELETIRALAQNANARIYIGFDSQRPSE